MMCSAAVFLADVPAPLLSSNRQGPRGTIERGCQLFFDGVASFDSLKGRCYVPGPLLTSIVGVSP